VYTGERASLYIVYDENFFAVVGDDAVLRIFDLRSNTLRILGLFLLSSIR